MKLKLVNLEEGMPPAPQAIERLHRELAVARQQGYAAVKIIHGYGSSGVGGVLRVEVGFALRGCLQDGKIRQFIAGEDWRISDEATWELLKKHPDLKKDADLGKNNRGITIVIL